MGSDPKEQAWSSEEVIVPAGADLPYEASFEPDWWIVQVSEAIATPVYVYRSPGALTERMRLIGTGQRAFPGKKDQRRILLQNAGLLSAKLEVIASVGYPATQVVDPVTLAKALSAEIQSQTHYELALANMGTPRTFDHQHIGRWCFLGLNVGSSGTDLSSVTGVTLGGAAGVLLVRHKIINISWGFAETTWWLADTAEGPITISLALSNGLNDTLCAWALSFTDGIRAGNVGGLDDGPGAFNVLGQSAASKIFSLSDSVNGANAETSGAGVWEAMHQIDASHRIGMHGRTGLGLQPFAYNLGPMAAAAVEILPIG